MPRQKLLLKLLNKTYQANAFVYMIYKGLDMTVRTDGGGNPIAMLLGKRLDNGAKHESHFEKTLSNGALGSVLKWNWKLKPKPTGFWG